MPSLTENELQNLHRLPFAERSLISMRCHIARNEPRAVRDQILRDAINS